MASQFQIQTVNLRDFHGGPAKRHQFIGTVGEAVRTTGFIRVQGIGLQPGQIEWFYGRAREIFALGPEVLAKYARPGNQIGYIPFGVEQAAGAEVPDLKHFFQVFDQRQGQNVWPAEKPEFRAAVLTIYDTLEWACRKMLEAIAISFGHRPNFLADMTTNGASLVRVIEYPPLTNGVVGLRSEVHTDINFGTALVTSDGEGLEVLAPDGIWIPVNSEPGEMIYNTADMLALLTRGVVKSVKHRVVNPTDPTKRGQARYSCPFFHHPRHEVVLDPSSERVVDRGAMTAGMFLELRLWEIHNTDERPAWYVGPDRKPKKSAAAC